jgi:hypothetical protein
MALSPPPIVDALFENKRLTSKSWIMFFQRVVATINGMSSGTGTVTTGKIPFYKADGTAANIDLV